MVRRQPRAVGGEGGGGRGEGWRGGGGQTTNCRSKPEEAQLRLPAAGADEGHTAATTQAGSVGVDEHRPEPCIKLKAASLFRSLKQTTVWCDHFHFAKLTSVCSVPDHRPCTLLDPGDIVTTKSLPCRSRIGAIFPSKAASSAPGDGSQRSERLLSAKGT